MGRFACDLESMAASEYPLIAFLKNRDYLNILPRIHYHILYYCLLQKATPFCEGASRCWMKNGEKGLTRGKYGAIIYLYNYYYIIGKYPVLAEVRL